MTDDEDLDPRLEALVRALKRSPERPPGAVDAIVREALAPECGAAGSAEPGRGSERAAGSERGRGSEAAAGSETVPPRTGTGGRARTGGGVGRAWAWLTGARLTLSPLGAAGWAGGVALVAALAVAAGIRSGDGPPPEGTADGAARTAESAGGPAPAGPAPAGLAADPGEAPAGPEAGVVRHRFVLVAPGARRVSVVGDFNDWDVDATPLKRADEVWAADVSLPPGHHVYSFVVDGEHWVPDAAAPRSPDDEFGRPSSVVLVTRGS